MLVIVLPSQRTPIADDLRASVSVYTESGTSSIATDLMGGPSYISRLSNIQLPETGTYFVRVAYHSNHGFYQGAIYKYATGLMETDENDDQNNATGNGAIARADTQVLFANENNDIVEALPVFGLIDAGDVDWYGQFAYAGDILSAQVTVSAQSPLNPLYPLRMRPGIFYPVLSISMLVWRKQRVER